MRRLVALVMVVFCASVGGAESAASSDLATLVEWMTGSFSSLEQSLADESYYDIRLEMVPIWMVRSDAHWLYVEQAAADAPDRPYRQRVYRVSELPDGGFESAVYELPDPEAFVGSWRDPAAFGSLEPGQLELREGCSVVLYRGGDGVFSGSTRGRDCASGLRGAAFASSEVRVYQDRLESWDRGFRDDGTQAWGAEKGPYIFRRTPTSAAE